MKTPLMLLLLALGCPLAAAPSLLDSERNRPLELIQTDELHFPFSLDHTGLMNGEAWVAVSVDPNGELEDVLITRYTRPEFADEAAAGLRRWHFHPYEVNGQPIAATREYHFVFSREGVVIDGSSVAESLNGFLDHLTELHCKYRSYSLHELDKIPVPVHVVSPAFPVALAEAGKEGRVTVTFYIDEEGKVRMPAVTNLAKPELAALAVQAVARWQFQPPRVRNQPVLVLTSQEFNFKPKS